MKPENLKKLLHQNRHKLSKNHVKEDQLNISYVKINDLKTANKASAFNIERNKVIDEQLNKYMHPNSIHIRLKPYFDSGTWIKWIGVLGDVTLPNKTNLNGSLLIDKISCYSDKVEILDYHAWLNIENIKYIEHHNQQLAIGDYIEGISQVKQYGQGKYGLAATYIKKAGMFIGTNRAETLVSTYDRQDSWVVELSNNNLTKKNYSENFINKDLAEFASTGAHVDAKFQPSRYEKFQQRLQPGRSSRRRGYLRSLREPLPVLRRRQRECLRYDANAPQPVTWLHFLSELLEDEDVLTLQEYLGYCLLPTNRGQTMMLLKGNGGEGKSRIGVVMQKMLGDNLKNGSIAKVERSPFARADLEHQLVMVDDDMKMEALKSTHYLKSLITAEMPMDLERKGEQSYQGQMYVRFLAFSNGDLESLYDHSDGFYRRQLILSVKKKPLDREDDPFLADKLCAEIEGIFLWCLEGLRRLIANNYRFTESARTKDNRVEAKQEADNVLLFLRSEGYIRLKADSTITSVDLYAIYTMWCEDNAYKPLAARTVSMTLKKHADEFGLEHDNHIMSRLGKRVNGFWGIEALVTPPIL